MSDKSTHSKILILDFGSQYTQVIARRIRECQVYSEIIRFDTPAAEVAASKPNGLILSGGPASVYDKGAPQIDPKIFSLGVPVLGICYGLMLMANHLGGRVVFSGRREYGAGVLHIKNGSELLGGLGEQLDVWNSHGDEVTALPERLSRRWDHRRLRFRRGGRSTAEALRIAISSRSRTHAAWPGDSSEFSVSHLPLRDGLDNGLLH